MMTKRYEHLDKIQDDLDLCTECGSCTFWCPMYQEDPRESTVARGKIAILREVQAGERDLDDESASLINQCLLCGTCLEHCPQKSPTPSIIVSARADRARSNRAGFPYNIIYSWLLPRRRLFGNVLRLTSWLQGIFLPKTQGSVRHLAFFLTALGKGGHGPSIAPKFLRQMVPVVNKCPAGTETRMRVGYFMGCTTDFVLPRVGKHVIDFLTRNGVEVVVPREQGCCGAPVYLGAGDFDTGRKMADTNAAAFQDVDYVVGSCATCTSAMKDYVQFLADTPERKAAYARFAEKLKDITAFLVDDLALPASAYRATPDVKGKKITWHDPCNLNRYLGITEQPRQILKSMPDVEFVEMIRPDWCCGMAGASSVYYDDLSKKIADKKMDTIETSGADIVVTGCPGCQIQLLDNAARRKLPVEVKHIMELFE